LVSRPSRNAPGGSITGAAFDAAARRLIDEQLNNAPTSEARDAARLVLSNPMDLTYASELLALGEMPRPTAMIGQAFRLACTRYTGSTLRAFPERAFALKTVELRAENRNFLYPDEFADEQPALAEYRLMVRRPIHDKAGKETDSLLFRHDKVTDFFMYLAFAEGENLQQDHMDDTEFRGVYLLFAQDANLETALLLRDLLVTRAAETLDHAFSDEFVRRVATRNPVDRRADSAQSANAA
jgi:hypothetical protein